MPAAASSHNVNTACTTSQTAFNCHAGARNLRGGGAREADHGVLGRRVGGNMFVGQRPSPEKLCERWRAQGTYLDAFGR